MTTSRRSVIAFAAISLAAGLAQAQAWPAKPIRLIVPFPAGGGTDIITREVANRLQSAGYTFVVENRPGSGGNLGVDAAAKANLYAAAAGMKLGKITSIAEAQSYGGPMPVFMEAKAASPVPVASGQIALQSQVTVVYELAD